MPVHHPAAWLRHGDTTNAPGFYPALATAPALVSDGVAIPPADRDHLCKLLIAHAAAGARSFTVVIWAYKPVTVINVGGVLTPITGAGSHSAEWVNIAEVVVNEAANGAEGHQLEGLSGFTRVAAQITVPVGAPTVWIDFGFSPHEGV